jgi:hypothetical protein
MNGLVRNQRFKGIKEAVMLPMLRCCEKLMHTIKIRPLVLVVFAVTQLYWLNYLNDAYIDSIIEGSLTILEDKKDAPQNDWITRSNNTFQSARYDNIPQADRLRLVKHRFRHAYNTTFTSDEVEQRIVLFVHFHKAGGTSMIHKFQNGGYQSWNQQTNGIPLRLPPPKKGEGRRNHGNNHTEGDQLCRKRYIHGKAEMLQFWRYSRPQFEAFLRDGRSQQPWPYCLPRPERTEDPKREAHNGVEFVSLEWNFLVSDHFFNKDYLRNQAKIDVITILRDPYDRFISNFYFPLDNPGINYDDPMKWAHLDLIQKNGKYNSFVKPNKRKVHLPHYQYGEKIPHSFHFSVNYNKPNYYTAFLNGLAENTDDAGDDSVRFDFEYYAFGLNRTHLDIAKQRLESIFDAILILERPETHGQLDRWFAFLGETDNSYYPHRNKNDMTHMKKKSRAVYHPLNFTREEFYRYNALDKELYDFALELSLSKSEGTTTPARNHSRNS